MGEPIEVTTATDAYRREMDTLGDFIDEKCVVGAAKTADAGALYQSFHNWLDVNGELQMTQKQFGTYLRERGFESGKKRGSRCWFGLRLRADGDDALSD
jgi:putative DNA primase/helicase